MYCCGVDVQADERTVVVGWRQNSLSEREHKPTTLITVKNVKQYTLLEYVHFVQCNNLR